MFQLREINKMEGDASVFGVGAECGPGNTQGIRGNGTQRLCRHWLIPDLHPPVNRVDAATLCDPLPPHLWHQSLTLERTTLYVSAQGPLRPLAPFLCVATRDPVTVLFNIISCISCVTPHHHWRRGPLGQDCLSVVIARLASKAINLSTAHPYFQHC